MNINAKCFVSMLIQFAVCHPNEVLNRRQVLEIDGQLNTLLSQPGWRYMDISVKKTKLGKGKQLKLNDNENTADDQFLFIPASELLEVNIPSDHVVTLKNLSDKYKNILIVLQCKYAEVSTVYRLLITHLIDTCRLDMYKGVYTFRKCYEVVNDKLGSISVTLRYMKDALEFLETISYRLNSRQCMVLKSLSDLEAFTRKISLEIKSILDRNNQIEFFASRYELCCVRDDLIEITKKNLFFVTNYCLVPHQEVTPEFLADDFVEKTKYKYVLPSEETLFDYIGHKIDSYTGHIIKKWFYRLGFVYDATQYPEKVTFNKDILS